MNKKLLYELLSIYAIIGNNSFHEIITDEKINDCLIELYFSMLCKNSEQSEYYYLKFEDKYNDLNDEQKEIAKIEIAKILNIEYKPKIKKKER